MREAKRLLSRQNRASRRPRSAWDTRISTISAAPTGNTSARARRWTGEGVVPSKASATLGPFFFFGPTGGGDALCPVLGEATFAPVGPIGLLPPVPAAAGRSGGAGRGVHRSAFIAHVLIYHPCGPERPGLFPAGSGGWGGSGGGWRSRAARRAGTARHSCGISLHQPRPNQLIQKAPKDAFSPPAGGSRVAGPRF